MTNSPQINHRRLTVKETAQRLGLKPKTIYNLLSNYSNSDKDYKADPTKLYVYRCPHYNISLCSASNWTRIDNITRDLTNMIITAEINSFSSYILAEFNGTDVSEDEDESDEEKEYLEILEVKHQDVLESISKGIINDHITSILEEVAREVSSKFDN